MGTSLAGYSYLQGLDRVRARRDSCTGVELEKTSGKSVRVEKPRSPGDHPWGQATQSPIGIWV